jgi:hypothetical protein
MQPDHHAITIRRYKVETIFIATSVFSSFIDDMVDMVKMRKHFISAISMSCECIAGFQSFQPDIHNSKTIPHIIDKFMETTQIPILRQILRHDIHAFDLDRMEDREMTSHLFDRYDLTHKTLTILLSILTAVSNELYKQVHLRPRAKQLRFAISEIKPRKNAKGSADIIIPRARSFVYTMLWHQCLAAGAHLLATVNVKKRPASALQSNK